VITLLVTHKRKVLFAKEKVKLVQEIEHGKIKLTCVENLIS